MREASKRSNNPKETQMDSKAAAKLVRDIAEGRWDGAVVATGLREKAKEIAGK